jgi:hypothetical protein
MAKVEGSSPFIRFRPAGSVLPRAWRDVEDAEPPPDAQAADAADRDRRDVRRHAVEQHRGHDRGDWPCPDDSGGTALDIRSLERPRLAPSMGASEDPSRSDRQRGLLRVGRRF